MYTKFIFQKFKAVYKHVIFEKYAQKVQIDDKWKIFSTVSLVLRLRIMNREERISFFVENQSILLEWLTCFATILAKNKKLVIENESQPGDNSDEKWFQKKWTEILKNIEPVDMSDVDTSSGFHVLSSDYMFFKLASSMTYIRHFKDMLKFSDCFVVS